MIKSFLWLSFFILLLVTGQIHAKTIMEVKGTGETAIIGITPEQAQHIALQRARSNAIEKSAGVHIFGTTLVKDASIVGDYIKSFTRGFIVSEQATWHPLDQIKRSENVAPIPLYSVTIIADIVVPEKLKDPTFFFISKPSLNKHKFITGETATIQATLSKKAYLAVFNIRADDNIAMLFPQENGACENIIGPSRIFKFPLLNSADRLEIIPLPDHRQDSEAFLVTAIPCDKCENFDFLTFFSVERLYAVSDFFCIYSKFADLAIEEILPYLVMQKH